MAKKKEKKKLFAEFGDSIRGLFQKRMSQAIQESNNKKEAKIARNFTTQSEAEKNELLLDAVLLRCIKLSISASTKHGYYIKADDKRVKTQIENFVDYQLGFKEYSGDLLNALLGPNNNVAILTGVGKDPILRLQYEKSDKAFQEETAEKIKELRGYDKASYFCATNIFCTRLGLSPLQFARELLAEKLYLQRFNLAYAKANGKLNQIITFNKDFATVYLGQQEPTARAFMDKIIEELVNNTIQELENLIIPIPLEVVNFQDTNRDMQFVERIRQINYSICAAYGVPPSLVGFDETTDPNLANGETQKDTFISLSIDDYKNLLEQIFTDIISRSLGISERKFKFNVGREVNAEALEKSQQLIRAMEKISQPLQQLGYDIDLDEELFKNIGITITRKSAPLPMADPLTESTTPTALPK